MKHRILCVDDEPRVLEGLVLTLGGKFEVTTATSGADALGVLESDPERAVIVSDMRMPSMDGATFLARARQVAPEATRILLTGHSDIEAAIAAVNEGQIFRFLTKPCAPPALLTAVSAAVAQHELVTAQRVLLEGTLQGVIKAMTEVLALTNPTAFGRTSRIKQMVSDVLDELKIAQRWQIEVAALVCQLGCITLPKETAERLCYGRPLSSYEQKLVEKLPSVTEQLLANIPRMETVRQILAGHGRQAQDTAGAPSRLQDDPVYTGARLLKIAIDFDALESQKVPSAAALETMRARSGWYDATLLAALAAVEQRKQAAEEIYELAPNELRVGMILIEDVKMGNGMLLAARGHEVTQRFLELIRNFPKSSSKIRVRIVARSFPFTTSRPRS